MSAHDERKSPQVVYSPPSSEVLDAFARQVCRHFGDDYLKPDVVEGLSTFIKVAAEIQVKHLNKNGEAS